MRSGPPTSPSLPQRPAGSLPGLPRWPRLIPCGGVRA